MKPGIAACSLTAGAAAVLRRAGLPLFLLLACVAGAAPADRQAFNLPADAAEAALRKLALQSGLEVVHASGLTAGVRTNEVRAELTPLEAANRMLAFTGLVAVQDAKTGALIVSRAVDRLPAPARPPRRRREPPLERPNPGGEDEAIELSPFEVSGRADRGYGTAEAAGATRIALPVSEVPGHVATINQELIQDTGGSMHALGEVAKYISGITYSNEIGQGSVTIRGSVSRGGSLVEDGLPGNAIAGGSAAIALLDLNMVDRIEVIKGPNGILYGAHALGGVINRVTKKPLPVRRTSLTAWAGSYDTWGASLDATGPVGENRDLLYRVILTEQQGRGPNGEDNDLRTFNPQFEYRLADDTTVRVAYAHVSGRVPRTNYAFVGSDPARAEPHWLWDARLPMQAPGEVFREAGFHQLTWTLNHSFEVRQERWNLNLVGRYTDTETDWLLDQTLGTVTAHAADGTSLGELSLLPVGTPIASVRTANVFRRLFLARDTRWLANLDVTGKFRLGAGEHVFFTGLQVTTGKTHDVRYSFTPVARAGGYEMWPGPEFPTLPGAGEIARSDLLIPPGTETSTDPLVGWTVQDNLRMFDGRLIATAGLRWDGGGRATTRQIADGTSATTEPLDVWTPKFGLIVKPLPGVSLFANKTQTYEVNRRLDVRLNSPTFGRLFPHRDGKTEEYGAKLDLFENRLQLTASAFDIELTNGLVGVTDDDFGTVTGHPRGPYHVPAGSLTTRGEEVDLAVMPFDGLQCLFGWSRLKARTEGGSPLGGGVPSQTLSGLARYSFGPGAWKGLSLGAGAYRVEGRVASNSDARPIPDYTVLEAFVGYRRGPWELQVNVKNLTDEAYIVSAASALGWPRTFSVRLRYGF